MSTPRSAADFVDTFRESGDLPPRVAKVVEDIIADYGIDTHAIVTSYLEEVLVAGTEIHSRRIARHVRRRLVRLLELSHESPAQVRRHRWQAEDLDPGQENAIRALEDVHLVI